MLTSPQLNAPGVQTGVASLRAAQICANDAKLCGFATPGALRSDVVEDAVVTEAKLVHGRRGKDVRFADGDVARVVDDSLVAAKGVGFGKSGASRQARRNSPDRN